ncbi:MAG: TlpA family protein disulfide reductase, partial [Gemmatimonadetes bacterium]|nr:TlpA family protein disulfide reductase [Gemmatimonadota bacterium]
TQWLIRTGMEAPGFGVVDAKGDSLRLGDFRGRYVLLDFWFTTCPPCLDELPRIRALQRKYADRFVVVGISIDRDRDRFSRFLQREEIDWPQVLDVLDNAGAVQAIYQAPYYPSYWLVNPDGEIALHGRHVLQRLEEAGLQYDYAR